MRQQLIIEAEEVLGSNLQWIAGLADLSVRQGDPEALRRLQQLTDLWKALVVACRDTTADFQPGA